MLNAAVSFAIQVEKSRIVAASSPFSQLIPEIIGSTLESVFDLEAGALFEDIDGPVALKAHPEVRFTLLSTSGIADQESFAFLPSVESIKAFRKAGLTPEDLSLSDPVRGYWLELERYAAEEERRNRELQNAERMVSLGTLAAGVAHEINNPLAFIKSNLMSLDGFLKPMVETVKSLLEIAQRQPEILQQLEAQGLTYDEEELSFILEDLDDILVDLRDGSERIVTIVSGLKQYSHPSRQAPAPTDLNDVIRVAIELSRNEFKYHAKLETDLNELPPIKANSGELTQVLVNLLVNAAQAIPEHGRIWVRTARVENQVEVRVGDTGTGMAPELIDKIFDPFYTTKDVGKGTGLGLSISQRIVNEHGGQIEVISEPNKGTEFVLRFPLDSATV